MQTFWYKNALVYSLDVETFMDSDGDGIGDFRGLTNCLDYLAGLGINCLWLLPFYPSPNRDNGYDVMDYYDVDPRLGTLGDFVEFIHQSRERGIRVLVDLVVNHTSIEHPWFQSARQGKTSKYHDYYVWSDNPEPNPALVAFPTVEESIWEYDEQAGASYLHHFYKEQPDLNIANPKVQEEILRIMGFWLELGVSGFRIDAAPFLIEEVGMENAHLFDLKQFLERMREFLANRSADAILLAEANVSPDQIPVYFDEGNRMQMLFNFLVNQNLFLALARQDAATLKEGLKILPSIPHNAQWLNFVRHHDELTLDRLSDEQQQEIFAAFAPEESMQIFGRGIRRRLPPMMQNDRRRIEMTYSLAFTLPGTPLVRYGDEIGMGDDLSLEGRESVRTVMQWSNAANGGFSKASPDALTRPVISKGEYGYQQVNVAFEQRDPTSFLNWMEHLIITRRQCPEFGSGKWRILETDKSAVFAHACEVDKTTVIALHNLSDQSCIVNLPEIPHQHLMEIFSDNFSLSRQQQKYDPLDENSYAIAINAYGYRWFRMSSMD
ncbi:alpha-amylase family protein [Ancylothrix sp. C2]|uniref:alpha-amylase family protein n=1 Tax=Ancylothrix sp. D3o TaxID=2953691 RepID=UPI0021BB16A4|nr:alpha-amylase family protein [Ancylothrix sp. D3o]MCT7949785.1 alpha-amylase family protein [Ancylothrix sp. D3o]